MTLAVSGTLEAGMKYQHLPTLVCGEALRHFDWFSDYVEGTETLNVDYIIRGKHITPSPSPVNFPSKQKRAMRRVMKKPRALTVRDYATRLIDLNEYLTSFTGANLNDKIGTTKLNEILLNSTPNSWSRNTYLKGFDCDFIT